jgi:hypothetical protein
MVVFFTPCLFPSVYAWSISTTLARVQTKDMGYAQVLTKPEAVPDARPRYHSNVVPLRALRAQFEVFLTGASPDALRKHLVTLLHSPLGVYVSRTNASRNMVCVELKVAPEDLDFTLHTLITTLPEATIGPIKRRNMREEC